MKHTTRLKGNRYHAPGGQCVKCGEQTTELYPNRACRCQPKPTLAERRKYCISCWSYLTRWIKTGSANL